MKLRGFVILAYIAFLCLGEYEDTFEVCSRRYKGK